MFGRHRYNDGFEDGVEATIHALELRGDRVGGVVDVHNAVLEIRCLLLKPAS